MTRRLTLDDLSRLPLPGTDHPAAASFVPGRHAVSYLQSADGSLIRSLWLHDLESGGRRLLCGPVPGTEDERAIGLAERLRRERTRTTELGVTDHAWASDSDTPTLLVPLAGRLLVSRGEPPGGRLAALPGIEGAAGAALSPDGRWVAYSASGDLWAAPVTGGALLRLTTDAAEGITNGLAEYIAAEELDRFDGLWWSADSRSVAFARVDERGVPVFDIGGVVKGEREEHHYPFAGAANARVELRVVGLDGAPPRAVDLGMAVDDYLARVLPDPTGGWLAAVLPRDQRSLHWYRVGPAGSARTLWIEQAEPWFNLDAAARVLADGRILCTSERSGFRHLEVRAPDGSLDRVLTAGDWVVTGVAAASVELDEVLFTATRDSVLERHLYTASLTAGAPASDPKRLTEEPGWHEIVAARDGSAWLDTFSDASHAPRVSVHPRGGGPAHTIHSPVTTAPEQGYVVPQLLELAAADGSTTLHAALFEPAATGSGPPPCVVWVYGGPHSQYVKRAWDLTAHPLRQYLAQCGAAVLMVDNRGTNSRGVAFEAALGGRLGAVEVADQAAAVRQLAGRGEIDSERVAITGWSYGGFMVVRCMALEPGIFRAGVAGAPVVEWRGYDTAYTERYLGHPAEQLDAYRESSLPAVAARVTGDLLLVHGSLDENVHRRHSTLLLEALRGGARQAELVLLEGQRHRTRGHAAIRLREQRTVRHLLRSLGLPLPEELAEDG